MSSGMPVDFGVWTLKDGRRAVLTWWPDAGRLTLDGPAGPQTVAVISSEDEVRRRLQGYEDHCDTPQALSWLAQALEGVR